MANDIIKLHTPQLKVFKSRKALTLNMAGQRAGKSHLIGVKSGLYVMNAPKIKGMIAANTYMQLTQSTLVAVKKVWKDNFGLTEYDSKGNPNGHYVIHKHPPSHFKTYDKFDNYRSIISFINGGLIFAVSLDNYMAHDGKEIGWAELDETKDTKEEALKAVILARLSQPGLFYETETGHIMSQDTIDFIIKQRSLSKNYYNNFTPFNPCCINTSPAVGVVKWLTDMFNLQEYDKEIHNKVTNPQDYFYMENENQSVCIYSTYWNAHNLPDNYIEIRLSQLSENEGLKYVFGYPFARTGNSFFRNFKKSVHVAKVQFKSTLPVNLSYDFNSKPYMTLLASQSEFVTDLREFQIRIFKEYCLPSPLNSTEAVTKAFIDDYGHFDPFVNFFGDASGDYRQAGSGDHTQFDTVRNVLAPYISRSSDRVPRKNKNVLNRRDFVDRILEFKLQVPYGSEMFTVVLLIDESCANLIADMQWLKEGLDGKFKEKEKDKDTGESYEKYGHTSDALEYLICELLDEYYQK